MRSEASYFSESWPANSRDWFLMLSIAMCMMELARYATSIPQVKGGRRWRGISSPSPEFPGNFTSVPSVYLNTSWSTISPRRPPSMVMDPCPLSTAASVLDWRSFADSLRPLALISQVEIGPNHSSCGKGPGSTLASSRPGMRRWSTVKGFSMGTSSRACMVEL